MSEPFRCPQCGNLLDTSLAEAKFDGSCPWCLAKVALDDRDVPGGPPLPPLATGIPFGRYLLNERLGMGGMGEVWKAKEIQLDRWVALKFLKKEDPAELARFQREAQTAAGLTHPGIAAIYEVGEFEGRHYIAMQYVPGVTLAAMPHDNRSLIVRLVRDAARAVDYAHQKGIIHRDVKPENLMIEETSEGPRVVVLDFGLARPLEGGEKLSRSGDIVGTAAYMSPEQAQGEKVDPRSDVYSLGATLYELLAGRSPFAGDKLLEVIRKVCHEEPDRLRKIDPKIHRDLETIVLKCIEKSGDRRYASGRDLADDLDRFLNHEPIVARPPSTVYRLRMTLAKRKAVVVAVAAVLVLITSAAIVVPKWLHEIDWRKRVEKARPHLEAGRAALQRMKNRQREAYAPEDLKTLGEQARAYFERALVEAPDYSEAHLGIALAFGLNREKELALEALGRAITADPRFAPAYLERARLRIDDYEDLRHEVLGSVRPESPEGRALRDKLEFDLKRAEQFSKEYPQQLYIRALFAFADGNYEKAAAELTLYLEREPEDPRACNWMGHSLYHLDRYPEALGWLDRGLKIDTGDHIIHNLRGTIRQAQKKYDGAALDFKRAIEIKSDFQMAHYNLGNVKLTRGDHAGSIPSFDEAIRLKKDAKWAMICRAMAYQALGDVRKALEDYDRALDCDKDLVQARVSRAYLRHQLGDWTGAMDDCNLAIRVKKDAFRALHLRGILKKNTGDLRGAIEDFRQAIGFSKDYVEAYCNLGITLLCLDQVAEAIENFDLVIKMNPKFGLASLYRGQARADLGDAKGALEDYERAISLKTEPETAFYNSGTVRRMSGDFEGALADFRMAIVVAPRGWRFLPVALRTLDDAENLVGAKDRREAYLRGEGLYVESNRLAFDRKPAEAAEGFRKIAEELPEFELGNLAAFNAGSLYALIGEKEKAFHCLEKAVDLGFRRLPLLMSHPRLASIRSDDRYQKLIERIRSNR